MSSHHRGRLAPVVAGGIAAGILDITAAFIVYAMRGVPPIRILQAISSGLLGRVAFDGGSRTALLGLLLHFFIAFVAAWVYFTASRIMPALSRRPFVFGPLYGLAVYVVMTFVVVPLSAVARRPFSPGLAAIIVVVHMVCVGLPIALAVRRYSVTQAAAQPAGSRSD